MFGARNTLFVKGTLAYMNVTVTGGTVETQGGFKVATFTSNGSITINSVGSDKEYGTLLEYALIGGGGSGGGGGGFSPNYLNASGGGGGGGVVEGNVNISAAKTYEIIVGAGGAATAGNAGNSGANSSITGIATAVGGGGGGGNSLNGKNGGSGGGGAGNSNGGVGIDGQGHSGGSGIVFMDEGYAGGGGGAGSGGGSSDIFSGNGGAGGPGRLVALNGTSLYYSVGGSGSSTINGPSFGSDSFFYAGGGGDGGNNQGGKGADGVVIIKWNSGPRNNEFTNTSWWNDIIVTGQYSQFNAGYVTIAGLAAGVTVPIKFVIDNAPPKEGYFIISILGYGSSASLNTAGSLFAKVSNNSEVTFTIYAGSGLGRPTTTVDAYNCDTGKLLKTFYIYYAV